jgi:hypothetical protein
MVLLIITGIILLGSGVWLFFRQRTRIARAITAEGVVIEQLRQRASGEYLYKRTAEGIKIEKKYLYRPVIRFKTEDGRTIKFSPPMATRPARCQVGDKVAVLYDPDKPQQAQINAFTYLWFYVLMLLFFGLFFLAIGLLGLVLAP